MIDHLTQFSVSRVIKTKQKEEIIKQDFRIWVSIFWSSKKFLVDNCGEFILSIFTYFVNICILIIAAESTRGKGQIETHNQILCYTVTKTMEDS